RDARHSLRLPDGRRRRWHGDGDHRDAVRDPRGLLPDLSPRPEAGTMSADVISRRSWLERTWVESRLVLVGLVLAFWTLVPLYHMAVLSITPVRDAVQGRLWPENPTLDNYRTVFRQGHFFLANFWQQLWNSVLVALTVMLLTLVIATAASFAIGRLKFRYG